MISSEGFRAFRGTMRIVPINGNADFTVSGDWIYNPHQDTWYALGRSFPAECCRVEKEEVG